MSRSTQCSGDEQLRRLLQDALRGPDRDCVVQHLDQCDGCAARLEQLAADDAFWKVTAVSLQTDDFDEADDPESSLPLSPVLKTLLAPSEDPCSLGRVGRFEVSIVSSVASGDLPNLSDFHGELPQWVYELVDWLHQIDPSERPTSARACADVLRCCEQHLLDPANHALPMCVNPEKKTSRLSWKLLLIAAVLTIVTSVSLQLWSGSRPRLNKTNVSDFRSGSAETPIESLSVIVDEMDREMADVMRHLESLAEVTQNENNPTTQGETASEIEE